MVAMCLVLQHDVHPISPILSLVVGPNDYLLGMLPVSFCLVVLSSFVLWVS